MTQPLFAKVLAFLQRLEDAKIAYTLKHSRPTAITVNIDIPGQRWEVDFLDDGDIDVERFVSTGKIEDESRLEELFITGDEETLTEKAENHHDAVARK